MSSSPFKGTTVSIVGYSEIKTSTFLTSFFLFVDDFVSAWVGYGASSSSHQLQPLLSFVINFGTLKSKLSFSWGFSSCLTFHIVSRIIFILVLLASYDGLDSFFNEILTFEGFRFQVDVLPIKLNERFFAYGFQVPLTFGYTGLAVLMTSIFFLNSFDLFPSQVLILIFFKQSFEGPFLRTISSGKSNCFILPGELFLRGIKSTRERFIFKMLEI